MPLITHVATWLIQRGRALASLEELEMLLAARSWQEEIQMAFITGLR
jgi:hypothetical protein